MLALTKAITGAFFAAFCPRESPVADIRRDKGPPSR
jgi:hypothetical protein